MEAVQVAEIFLNCNHEDFQDVQKWIFAILES